MPRITRPSWQRPSSVPILTLQSIYHFPPSGRRLPRVAGAERRTSDSARLLVMYLRRAHHRSNPRQVVSCNSLGISFTRARISRTRAESVCPHLLWPPTCPSPSEDRAASIEPTMLRNPCRLRPSSNDDGRSMETRRTLRRTMPMTPRCQPSPRLQPCRAISGPSRRPFEPARRLGFLLLTADFSTPVAAVDAPPPPGFV